MKLKPSTVQGGEEVTEDLPQYDGIKINELMKGFKVWKNPINKFVVARLHYSADPRKRTSQWRTDARAGIPFAEWMREYEIVWSSFKGVPVYAESYSKKFHVSSEPLQWAMEYPIVRGWDFGLDTLGMACVFTQLLSNSRLFIYNELVASDSDIYTFTEAVQRMSLEWFPGCKKYVDIVDPSGFNRDARNRDKKSYCDVIKETLKTKPIPGAKERNIRIKSVVKFLTTTLRGLPKIVISGAGCPTLVEGFDGGYHYGYAKDGQVKDHPEKNEHSHVHDALQGVCTRIERLDLTDERSLEIASPRYNFGR